MALEVPIGGGHVAHVNEPTRDKFALNLGGAVEFSFAHLVYKILEIMGGGVGAFLGGAGVQFLELVEPSLVEYTRPIIDMILAMKDLPAGVRDFFTMIREPTHEGAATILAGLASQAGGAVAGTVLGALLKPMANSLNQNIRGTIPSLPDLIAMDWRHKLSPASFSMYAQQNGYPDEVMYSYPDVIRPRSGVADLYQSYLRENISALTLDVEMGMRGFTPEDRAIFLGNQTVLLDPTILLNAVYRKVIDPQHAGSTLKKEGYTETDIETMRQALAPMPNVSDFILFGVREAYDNGVSGKWGYDADFPSQLTEDLAKLGYDPAWSRLYWRSHWQLPSVTLGTEMVHRGIITDSEYQELLRISDYPAGWRDKMQEVIYTPYTRVDVRRMYGQGILNREQVKQAYKDIGYNEERAENLTAFTIAYEDENGNSTKPEFKSATQGIISSAVSKGFMSDSDAKIKLKELEYNDETADLIISLAHWKQAVADKPAPKSGFVTDMRNITERAYMNGTIILDDAMAQLLDVGYTSEDAGFVLKAVDFARAEQDQEEQIKLIADAYLNGTLDRADVVGRLGALDLPSTQQTILLGKWDSILELPSRRLSEAQYRACFKAGIITAEDYTRFMVQLGYSTLDVSLLTQLYTVAPEEPPEE